MTRKEFLRLLSTALALRATPGAAAAASRSDRNAHQGRFALKTPMGGTADKNGRQPNVLIIMTDQHRPNYMTAAGNPLVPTPHIDRISQRGIRFTNAICPYPVCAASRMAFLTGQYAHTTGTIDNTDLLSWKTPTMAHHFSDSGYHTGLIGKMHFNDGHSHGFEYFLGFNDWLMYLGPKVQCYADEIANNPAAPQFFHTIDDDGCGFPELPSVWGTQRPWTGHVKHIGLASQFADHNDEFDAFVTRESCRFLERYGKDESPFFLVSSFLRPHPPLHPPHPWTDRYPLEQMTLPPVGDVKQYPRWIQERIAHFQGFGAEHLRAHRAGYLGNLAYVDTCIGELYQTLERLGLINNTIVIYTSDHGEMDGDHGLYEKFCLFGPSVGVPLIVSYPGHVPEGTTSDALVNYFGVFPTIAELTATQPPSGIEASSFASLVRTPSAKGPEAVYAEYNLRSANDCYMVRTARYKYIYNYKDIPELYDLESDPGETVNQGRNPSLSQVRNELHDRLMAWYDPASNPYRNTSASPKF